MNLLRIEDVACVKGLTQPIRELEDGMLKEYEADECVDSYEERKGA